MDTIQKLKSSKLKVTPQRIAILEYLEMSKEHPSAEIIYNAVSKSHPSISLATVYKTLDTFREANLVMEFNVGEDAHRYDGNAFIHPHFICNCCNSVLDMNEPDSIHQLFTDFEKCNENLNFENHSLYFYGRCEKCS